MDLLQEGARELGLDLTESQLAAFSVCYRELVDWNQRVNLTAVTDYEEVQTRHFLDSLTCLLAMAPRRSDGRLEADAVVGRAIDVGAGAGFPGVPLKIVCPRLRLTLLESVGKKARFLEHLAATLDLTGVEVIAARAEDLARTPVHRESYDFAIARALAPLPVLAEYCLPFLRQGGLLIALKKGDISREITEARAAIRVLGARRREPLPVSLSLLPDSRFLVLIDKVSPTPKAYPRRAGLPAKMPIGSRTTGKP
ncbi:MAG: 16S rRNA (guanine(527)-N(7))-methyltransferase RsmG [Chloroflexota bacterium]